MAGKPGTIELLTREISRAFRPLEDRLASGEVIAFFTELGVEFPAALTSQTAFVAALSDAVSEVSALPSLISDLETAIDAEDVAGIATAVGDIIDHIATILDKLDEVQTELASLAGVLTGISSGDVTAFATDLVKKLVDYLVIVYLEGYQPNFVNLLAILGIVEYTQVQGDDSDDTKPSYLKRELKLDRFGSLFNSPGSYFEDIYDWGDDINFDGRRMLDGIHRILISLAVPHVYDDAPTGTPSVQIFYSTLTPDLTITPKGLKITQSATLSSGLSLDMPFIFDGWRLKLVTDGTLAAGNELTIQPGGILKVTPPSGSIDGNVSVNLVGQNADPDARFLLFGKTSGSRMDAQSITVGFDTHFKWDSGSGEATGDLGFHLAVSSGQIVIKAADGDSFLQKIIPEDGITFNFDFTLGWRSDIGFYFTGSGGLEIAIPVHRTLAGISIETLYLRLDLDESGLTAELSADTKAEFGPFLATVSRLGIEAPITFSAGNLGPVNASVDFKPPTGIGLVINSDAVKGGGYLFFDVDNARYGGALELSIKDKISLKAIGILTTRLPGNQPGYSLLLLITAEFQPIQLGFGFTLNGVGGLIALNRTMNFDVLRAGVRNNSLDNILFPTDPVANINSILSSLESAFPIQEGRFAFGPMAIIGWGTPTLITAEIGLFIELPDPVRLAIIGVIKAILPDESKDLLRLQINFAGTIDFEAKFITFDASLFDSHLLWMTLSGDMAFRLKWGDDPVFVLSVGGFHPSFHPPALSLPSLARITVNLLGGDNPRLTLSTYFAVTSNTVQFGASIDFYYRVTDKIRVVGYLGFDALFRFSPFYFVVSIGASLAVYRKDKCLFGVWLSGSLEGPTPWHVRGSATFTVLGVDITVDFDKTFGDSQNTTLPDVAVLPKLVDALQNKSNWQALLPSGMPVLVSVREIADTPGVIIVHPHGAMGVSQKVVPLDFSLNKFGSGKPSDYQVFSLDITDTDDVAFAETNLQEYFAPGEFTQLSDGDRLSRKSFEKYNSGLQVQGADALKSGTFHELQIEYETVYMDSRYDPIHITDTTLLQNAQHQAFIRNNAAAKSPLGSQKKPASNFAPPKVNVVQEAYAVAQTEDLAIYSSLTANSEAEAQLLLESTLLQHPELEGKLQVVSAFELD